MKINQPKPRFIRHGDAQVKRRSHLLELPWVETSGHPASPYNYNNGCHAAVHSILAGMQCRKKKDVRYWLETAQRQLDDAVAAIKKPHAKVVPSRQNAVVRDRRPGASDLSATAIGGSLH